MNRRSVVWLVLAVVAGGCLVAAEGEPSGEKLTEVAKSFAEQFTEGKHEENLALMDETMRAASGPEPSEQLRKALEL